MKLAIEESVLRQWKEALAQLEEAARMVQAGEMDKQSIDVDRRPARDSIASMQSYLDAAEKVEPVARLLHWHGPPHYPVPHGGIAARTYAEFSREDADKPDSYWKNGKELYTRPAPAVPEGWQLVPKAPTSEMLFAGGNNNESGEDFEAYRPSECAAIYRDMLSAAPTPPANTDSNLPPAEDSKTGCLILTMPLLRRTKMTTELDKIALKIRDELGVSWGAGAVLEFARRLVEEIQARNEPIYLCWESGAWVESSIAEYNKTPEDDRWKLYTFPPDCGELSKDADVLADEAAERIEQLARELADMTTAATGLSDDLTRLGEQLAESQAREAEMRWHLTHIVFATSPDPDDGSCHENAYDLAVGALAIPTDDTALRKAIADGLRLVADRYSAEDEREIFSGTVAYELRHYADTLVENGQRRQQTNESNT